MDNINILHLNGKVIGTSGDGPVMFIENQDLLEAKVVFDTREDCENRDIWHKQRSKTIGGSDIAKVAGFSKYGSALTVFNEKLGLSEKFKGNVHTQFGTRMEPHIREWVIEDFKKETGIRLSTFEYPFMMVDKDYEYFSANIDGIGILEEDYIYHENRDTGEIKLIHANELFGLEIKTGSEFLKKMWAGEEVPDEYYCQCQWYMGITGLKYFLIIYLLGKEVKWKVIPRNDDDIKALRDIASDFWNVNIKGELPPMPTGLTKETQEIVSNQALSDDEEINITDEKLSQYNDVSLKIKDLEREKERLKQELFLEMGNSKKATDGLFKISRYTVKRETIDNKLLKDKYPATYEAVLKGTSEYVNIRVSKVN